MPTRAKRIKRLTGLLVLAALPVAAQQSAPPSSAPAPAPAPPAAAATPAPTSGVGSNVDSSTASALDYLFNHKPVDGSVAKEGLNADREAKTRALAQDALGNKLINDPDMRVRFERYLGMEEVPPDQIKAYADDMATVVDLLHQKKTMEAWRQLYKLASYGKLDAGVSLELANRIESIWNADATSNRVARENDNLKQQIDTANHNADLMVDDMRYQQHTENQKNGSSSSAGNASSGSSTNQFNIPISTSAQPGDLMGKMQLTEEYLHSLEAQARIKLNQLKLDKLFDTTKSDFADYITTLFKSGRYQHVLIAADFWRQIFDEGDYPVSMAQQVNASLETNREVINTIEVFNHSLDQKDISAATDRLQEAFLQSSFNPAVLGVPLSRKKPIEALNRQLNRMRNMIEARDFTELPALLAQIKQTAPDFDAVKPMAMVNAVELESQLRLGKARLAAQQGDLKTAMEEFQAAAEAWPGNPDLKDKALTFFNSQDMQNESLADFDRLVADNNYWGIFDKQLVYAPAMKDDPKRQEQLKAALAKVKIAATAIEKAKLMQSSGDVYGAWETVQIATRDLPDDLKLNALRGDLAGRAAEFVSAINKAQDAEARQELGYSLTWYAVAQRYYPASQLANPAIERLSKTILSKSSL